MDNATTFIAPNPATKKALSLKCTCPINDNRDRTDGCYWYNLDCKVHNDVTSKTTMLSTESD